MAIFNRLQADWRGLKTVINNARGLSAPMPVGRHTPGGQFYELYEPSAPVATVILVHGFSVLCEKDPRAISLARALASAGARVAVPALDGLNRYSFDTRDRDALIELALHLCGEFSAPVAFLAVSAGGSLSLMASRDPRLAGKISALVLVSPIYNMQAAWEAFHNNGDVPPENTQAWDDYVWALAVIAYRNHEMLGLSAQALEQCKGMLAHYSTGHTTAEKQAFFRDVIQPLNLETRTGLRRESAAMDELSPRGKLADVPCRVAILHTPDDHLVLPADTIAMHRELAARRHGQEWLLITPILAHAKMQNHKHLGDLLRFVRLLGEVFLK